MSRRIKRGVMSRARARPAELLHQPEALERLQASPADKFPTHPMTRVRPGFPDDHGHVVVTQDEAKRQARQPSADDCDCLSAGHMKTENRGSLNSSPFGLPGNRESTAACVSLPVPNGQG